MDDDVPGLAGVEGAGADIGIARDRADHALTTHLNRTGRDLDGSPVTGPVGSAGDKAEAIRSAARNDEAICPDRHYSGGTGCVGISVDTAAVEHLQLARRDPHHSPLTRAASAVPKGSAGDASTPTGDHHRVCINDDVPSIAGPEGAGA